jgi:serine/threonine protein kinase
MALRIEAHAEIIPGYRLLDRLGQGGFGEVWRVEAPGGLEKAIKIVHGDISGANEEDARRATQELKALKRVQSVRHPYLLSLERYDIVEGRLIIVMELADCNLWDRFRECRSQGLVGLPRDELLRYMCETAEVLDLMNSQYQLQHLDIKPQNLFLLHGHIKVADFGLVKDLEGVRAAITGGVTPLYAAPETFDGQISRFCDQYSLAIVYQELLTGKRPFDGPSIQQLINQHLQEPPNLLPLPEADRPAVLRALAKKPEDRFPTCMQFVRALIGGMSSVSTTSSASTPLLNLDENEPRQSSISLTSRMLRTLQSRSSSGAGPGDTPVTQVRIRTPESDLGTLVPRIAPPEQTGPGLIRPALVLGLGGIGLQVLQRFRQAVAESFKGLEQVPTLRVLGIDTDPEAAQSATQPDLLNSLRPEEVLLTRLNRSSHYVKPRRNGRSILDGWFDHQLLYRIPKNPLTQGMRIMGRLAFCDHYRTIAQRVREELETITHPDSLGNAQRNTNLGLCTNRPRVYVVASLCGGTGSGMFIDTAYMVRHQLKTLGYTEPDVVGVLLLPIVDRNPARTQGLANGHAALIELNHFSLPDTHYTASFDDRNGQLNETDPPFGRFFLIPLASSSAAAAGAAATGKGPRSGLPVPGAGPLLSGTFRRPSLSGVRAEPAPAADPAKTDAIWRSAELLRRELLTHLGRAAETARRDRTPFSDRTVCGQSVGLAHFSWPRQPLLSRTARRVAILMLHEWLQSDIKTVQSTLTPWLDSQWQELQFSPESCIARLHQECVQHLEKAPEAIFDSYVDPLKPRGWLFSRGLDRAQLQDAMLQLVQLVGTPDDRMVNRHVGQLEELLRLASEALAHELGDAALQLGHCLLEQPDLRLTGANLVADQLRQRFQDIIERNEQVMRDLQARISELYVLLANQIFDEPGRVSMRTNDLLAGLRNYPRWRYQLLMLRHLNRIYSRISSLLADQLREFICCKERITELIQFLERQPEAAIPDPDSALLPPGCKSIDHAVLQLLETITPEDLRILDRRIQGQIEPRFGSLLATCISSANQLPELGRVVEEQARALVTEKLGQINVVEMFAARYNQPEAAKQALMTAWESAEPEFNRVTSKGFTLLALPQTDVGRPLWDLARRSLPDNPLTCHSDEEIVIYREACRVPIGSLPQLGPLACEAYQQTINVDNLTPHTRMDVPRWHDPDQE